MTRTTSVKLSSIAGLILIGFLPVLCEEQQGSGKGRTPVVFALLEVLLPRSLSIGGEDVEMSLRFAGLAKQ